MPVQPPAAPSPSIFERDERSHPVTGQRQQADDGKTPWFQPREFVLETLCGSASRTAGRTHRADAADAVLTTAFGANPSFYQFRVADSPEQKGPLLPPSPRVAGTDATFFADDDARLDVLGHCSPQLSGALPMLLYHNRVKSPIGTPSHLDKRAPIRYDCSRVRALSSGLVAGNHPATV